MARAGDGGTVRRIDHAVIVVGIGIVCGHIILRLGRRRIVVAAGFAAPGPAGWAVLRAYRLAVDRLAARGAWSGADRIAVDRPAHERLGMAACRANDGDGG